MALSAIPNGPLAQHQESRPKNGAATEQSEKKLADLAATKRNVENKFDDNVNFSQATTAASEKSNGATGISSSLDVNSAEKLLQKTMSASMADIKVAVSAQSNLSPHTAQDLLADK
ncbi:MAG: hypothetical protein GY702_06150 [Desulfobulbaceae bacterium]|nr:hypothetical protein [Desulfobulbaceae bacterium]